MTTRGGASRPFKIADQNSIFTASSRGEIKYEPNEYGDGNHSIELACQLGLHIERGRPPLCSLRLRVHSLSPCQAVRTSVEQPPSAERTRVRSKELRSHRTRLQLSSRDARRIVVAAPVIKPGPSSLRNCCTPRRGVSRSSASNGVVGDLATTHRT
jgi:hypothetical protein